ncbi:ADP-ribosylglycohydrolase family protein [Shimia thalassica]|uniref:ADP-ribosylglycohydrolase family protein n=1 Tax=Shimia thalassica TaxID=1715693 RepID=UPI002733E60A|nr:ADP-ribosylglycohydrolase family protein [Shimia thalassica]MDP2494440.1 ADP-ribosylglycohydrolase family protein [Shimia thalassica]
MRTFANAGTTRSRAQGCLLGQLSGDALGSYVEFKPETTIAARHPDGVTKLQNGGTWNLIAGQATDDSEMALSLARSLVRHNGFNENDVALGYVRWRKSDPFDIGGTTASGIRALELGSRSKSRSQANGALMRVSPIGIATAGNPDLAAEWAILDSKLTHPSHVCQVSNAAFAAAVSVGVAGGTVDEMVAAAVNQAGLDQAGSTVFERLKAAFNSPPDEYYENMGWVLTAFQNAFYWLMSGATLEEAVIATVAKGGDTDTNGAICGALLGAAQGVDAIPVQWRDAVLSCRPDAQTPKPRPQEYWPNDVLQLSKALLQI